MIEFMLFKFGTKKLVMDRIRGCVAGLRACVRVMLFVHNVKGAPPASRGHTVRARERVHTREECMGAPTHTPRAAHQHRGYMGTHREGPPRAQTQPRADTRAGAHALEKEEPTPA